MTTKTLTPRELAAIVGRKLDVIQRACRNGVIPCEIVHRGASSRYQIPNNHHAIAAAMALPRKPTGRPRGAKDATPLVAFGPYRVLLARPGVYKLVRRGKGGKTYRHGVSPEIVIQAADIGQETREGLLAELRKINKA